MALEHDVYHNPAKHMLFAFDAKIQKGKMCRGNEYPHASNCFTFDIKSLDNILSL